MAEVATLVLRIGVARKLDAVEGETSVVGVEAAKNGSMQAEVGSGIKVMSDSLIAFQPAIDDPSNIRPSEKLSSSIIV
jgi:hypothetical protein